MRLTALQSARGIAALLVVLFHTNGYFAAHGWEPWRLLRSGGAGVEFFFVLSGFIMFHVHSTWIGRRRDKVGIFLWRRFARIYPIYWIALSTLVAVYALVPALGEPSHREDARIFTSFLLIPTAQMPVLYVAWSLQYEVIFYALFALIIMWPVLGFSALAFWGILGLTGLAWRPDWPLKFFTEPFGLLFIMGILAARASLIRMSLLAAISLSLAGFGMFMLTAVNWAYQLWVGPDERLLYGVGAMLLVVGLASIEQQTGRSPPRFLTFLGDASYSIYLTHAPAIPALGGALAILGVGKPISFALTVALLIAVGVGFHLAVERPLLRVVSRRPATQSSAV